MDKKIAILFFCLLFTAHITLINAQTYSKFGTYEMGAGDKFSLNQSTMEIIRFFGDDSHGTPEPVPTIYYCEGNLCSNAIEINKDIRLPLDNSKEKTIKMSINSIDLNKKRVSITFYDLLAGNLETDCYDSDGGVNYYLSGKLSNAYDAGNLVIPEDYCFEGNKLREFFCGESTSGSRYNYQWVDYSCPVECFDGACINKTIFEDEDVVPMNVHNNEEESKTCKELCSKFGGSLDPEGCFDENLNRCTQMYGGNCISKPKRIIQKDYGTTCCCLLKELGGCKSTDGANPFIRGRTTDIDGNNWEDKCVDENILSENSCSSLDYGQGSIYYSINCQEGCRDGACIKCSPIGSIDSHNFCSEEGAIMNKKKNGEYCKQDYSCFSNSCKGNKCAGFLRDLIFKIKGLFN